MINLWNIQAFLPIKSGEKVHVPLPLFFLFNLNYFIKIIFVKNILSNHFKQKGELCVLNSRFVSNIFLEQNNVKLRL